MFETKGGTKIECGSAEDTVSVTKYKLGTFDALFLECKSTGFKCTGGSDKTAGSILVKGELHTWYGVAKKENVASVVFLLKETTVTCAELVKATLKGCAAGLLKSINKKTKTLTAELIQEKGVNNITEVENEKGEKISCKLEASIGGGAFEQAGEQAIEEATKFKQNGKEIEVEVMA